MSWHLSENKLSFIRNIMRDKPVLQKEYTHLMNCAKVYDSFQEELRKQEKVKKALEYNKLKDDKITITQFNDNCLKIETESNDERHSGSNIINITKLKQLEDDLYNACNTIEMLARHSYIKDK